MNQTNQIKEVEEVIEDLYANNQNKLRYMCDKEISKFGGVSQKDLDDFYSRIGYELTLARKRYDPSMGKSFMNYVSGVIKHSIWKEMTDRNRMKRQIIIEKEEEDESGKIIKKKEYVSNISIDVPDENGLTIGHTLQSDFDVEKNLIENIMGYQDERVEKYLDSLSKTTRQLIEMKMNDIPVSEIKKKLGLTENEYYTHMNSARINENIALFTKQSNRYKEEHKMDNIIPIDVADSYRMDKFTLGTLLDDMNDGKINKKHILQRKPFQWKDRQINKFLTRVLNSQPIPEIVICEQTVKGKKKSHLIDGLQRLSYSELFRADGIVIKMEGAEFYEIPYKEYQYDEYGNVLIDEEGDALFKEKIFNVIGKKFSEFPQFLKDRFNKFNINVTTYFNCTDKQIAYHIRNYNNQEGMNNGQYEFTEVDIPVANKIKGLSEKHPFFKDCYGRYTNKNKIKGDIDKVVVESIMTINFLDNWKKEVKDSFAFVNNNTDDSMFDSLKDTLDRLCKIVDKELKTIFTTTNSPVWFAVFDKFKTLNMPDERFKMFIKYVDTYLDSLEVEGEKFVNIYKCKNTRNKKVVISKINGLITLMMEFLQPDSIEAKPTEIEKFIAENVGIDMKTIHKNMEVYSEDLDSFKEVLTKNGSKLFHKENLPSLLAMVAYSYKQDELLDKWILEYSKKTTTYLADQKENYLHMLEDFKQFTSSRNKQCGQGIT